MPQTVALPRGVTRGALAAAAGLLGAVVLLAAWILQGGGGGGSDEPITANSWVPDAGSVEWMRIERAQPGTSPLTDLTPVNAAALPVMEQVLAWLREAPEVAATYDPLVVRTDAVRFRVGEGRVITVQRAFECITTTAPIPSAPFGCEPVPDVVSVSDATVTGGGGAFRLSAPALASWLDGGWRDDIPTASRAPQPAGIPAIEDVASATVPGPAGVVAQPAQLSADDPNGREVLVSLLGWLAESTLVAAEPDWNLVNSFGANERLTIEARDGSRTTVAPAYDCAVERDAAGTVGASVCLVTREYVVLEPAPGRGEPARLWSPSLAAWLAGGWQGDVGR